MYNDYFDEDNESTIKIVIVGNGAVGKSSLIQRYCRGIFTNEYKKTIGVDFLERTIDINTQKIRLMCWDTAGQEEFDALTNSYYRGAHACIIAFSTTDRASFNSVTSWFKKIEHNCGFIPTILVQNKIDLLQQAKVSREEVNALSVKYKLPLFLTSSKENINIENAFYFLAKSYIDSLNIVESPVTLCKNIPKQTDSLIQSPNKINLKSIGNEQNLKFKNQNLYKSNVKNCWPTNNALMINNNYKNHQIFHPSTTKKYVHGRQSQLINGLMLPNQILHSSTNNNQSQFNQQINNKKNLSNTNFHFFNTTNPSNRFISPSSHPTRFLNNSQDSCKNRYVLLQNSNYLNLNDNNLYYTYYSSNNFFKNLTSKKPKTFSSNGFFSRCRIL